MGKGIAMKKVAVIVAMDKEFELVRQFLSDDTPSRPGKLGVEYLTGYVGDNFVILAKSGIGKVNAAMLTTCLLYDYDIIDAVVSTGVAGSLDRVKTGDVVVSSACQYWDVWCGKPNAVGQVQGMPMAFFPSGVLFKKAYLAGGTKPGLIVSGDKFVTTEKEAIRKVFPDAVAVDMESAAIAQLCYAHNVPWLALRVISDGCDEEAYRLSLDELAKREFNVVGKIIESL